MSNTIAALGSLGSIGSIGQLPDLPPAEQTDSSASFSGVLSNAIQEVNQLNTGAQQEIGNLLQGGNSDISSVMVAVEKADVAFQLMMQVRNKIVNAYQDIEKMQF
jgi:flagellar hook-basal body complex protein FliE